MSDDINRLERYRDVFKSNCVKNFLGDCFSV